MSYSTTDNSSDLKLSTSQPRTK